MKDMLGRDAMADQVGQTEQRALHGERCVPLMHDMAEL
jgi:hypothetical protein